MIDDDFIPEDDVYETFHDCERCVDYRKNLKCCRETVTLLKEIEQLRQDVEQIKAQMQLHH